MRWKKFVLKKLSEVFGLACLFNLLIQNHIQGIGVSWVVNMVYVQDFMYVSLLQVDLR
ncbi:hypothetical protein EMIT0324P_310003 [Pseudomonas chlororaphis]